MAQRIETFTVNCAAGVARATPTETSIGFAPGEVESVEIIIPDGHAGFTGIGLAIAHTVIVPYTAREFISGNDEQIKWPLEGYPNAGSWTAFLYNEDIFEHRWWIRFLIMEIPHATVLGQPSPIVTPAALEALATPLPEGSLPAAPEPVASEPAPTTPEPTEPSPAPEEPAPMPEPPPTEEPPPTGADNEPPLDDLRDFEPPPDIMEPGDEATIAELRAALASCRERGDRLLGEAKRWHEEYTKLHDRISGKGKAVGKVVGHTKAVRKPTPHAKPAPKAHGTPNPHVSNSIPGHPEVHSEVAHIVNQIRAEFPDAEITSTTGGKHAANSFHYKGEAVDLIRNTRAKMDEAGKWIAEHLTGQLTEGIHNPTLSVKNGKSVPPSFWGNAVWVEHEGHIHVARAAAVAAAAAAPPAHHEAPKPVHHAAPKPAHHEAPKPAPHHEAPKPPPPHHEPPKPKPKHHK